MKSNLIVFTLLFVLTIHSQSKQGGPGTGQVSSYNPIFSDNYSRQYKLSLEKNENIKGTRFIFEDFGQKGLVFINDVVYTAYGINIDAINNEIVTLIGNDSIMVLEKDRIDSLQINKKDFKKFNGDTFYEVLNNGKNAILLKEYHGKILEGYENVMNGTKNKDSYVVSSNYLIKKGIKIEKLQTSKKKILDQFSDKESYMKQFLKKNKLSVKEEEDLIEIFEYYNSL